eukprot:UN01940
MVCYPSPFLFFFCLMLALFLLLTTFSCLFLYESSVLSFSLFLYYYHHNMDSLLSAFLHLYLLHLLVNNIHLNLF